MICNGIETFRGRRVLMLQGPVGPFFCRLSRDFESIGALVFKVNFNGGDWLFYPRHSISYRGTLEEWPAFFENLVIEHRIDDVLLFGDCRPVHLAVRKIAMKRNLRIGVFEEGYVRPDYVTFELFGVNANSSLPRKADFYLNGALCSPPPQEKVGKSYWYMAAWAVLYYLASAFLNPLFPHYVHHRPLTLMELFPWIRSAWRKLYYRVKEREIHGRLTKGFGGRYFLAPLQVHNDSQLLVHSEFDSVHDFIKGVVDSFMMHAPKDFLLVIKHHPLDRGYYDYSRLIRDLVKIHHLENRLLYIHDQHLPSLIRNACGVVVVNSTVGYSALLHGKPVKCLGAAFYDIAGMTFHGTLDQFWLNATTAKPARPLLQSFHKYMITRSQLNGSFYRRLKKNEDGAGLVWKHEINTEINSHSENAHLFS